MPHISKNHLFSEFNRELYFEAECVKKENELSHN